MQAPESAPAEGLADAVIDIGFRSGFPADTAVCARLITADLARHALATSPGVSRSAPIRRREYVAGRLCAGSALRSFGVDCAPLERSADGAPCWPEGFVGSIAHSRRHAVAAAARTGRYRAIGVDVEDVAGVSPEIWPIIATGPELAYLESVMPSERQWAATKIFSAKEAFYKCQFPLTRQFLDFKDVEITLWHKRFSVALKCNGPAGDLDANAFRGSISTLGGEVITLVDLLV